MSTPERKRAILGALQAELAGIYRFEAPLAVQDYVLERAHWEELSVSGAPEELVVVERDGELEVGLFIDDDVVSELDRAGDAWTLRRLAAHCQAVEGVSHFLYLTQRAAVPRQVSQLELELQAEIDKFATVLISLWRVGRRSSSGPLLERLFERVSYRENLSPEAQERYEKANVLARLYCKFLEARYVVRDSLDGLLADLRRMYRLGAGEKLSYAARGALI